MKIEYNIFMCPLAKLPSLIIIYLVFIGRHMILCSLHTLSCVVS